MKRDQRQNRIETIGLDLLCEIVITLDEGSAIHNLSSCSKTLRAALTRGSHFVHLRAVWLTRHRGPDALRLAAKYDCYDTVCAIMKHSDPASVGQEKGMSVAVTSGRSRVVEALLDNGFNPNASICIDPSPQFWLFCTYTFRLLEAAIVFARDNVVLLLMDRGADLSPSLEWFYHRGEAIEYVPEPLYKRFLRRVFQHPRIRAFDPMYVLDCLIEQYFCNDYSIEYGGCTTCLLIIEAFLDHGMMRPLSEIPVVRDAVIPCVFNNFHERMTGHMSGHHRTVDILLWETIQNGLCDMIHMLASRGASVKHVYTNSDNALVLHDYCHDQDRHAEVRMYCPDVEEDDESDPGPSVLDIVAKHRFPTPKLLTPLHHAVLTASHPRVARALLIYGADTTARDQGCGKRPADYLEYVHPPYSNWLHEMTRLLKSPRTHLYASVQHDSRDVAAASRAIEIAACRGSLTTLRELCAWGAHLCDRRSSVWALRSAGQRGHIHVVRYLCSLGVHQIDPAVSLSTLIAAEVTTSMTR